VLPRQLPKGISHINAAIRSITDSINREFKANPSLADTHDVDKECAEATKWVKLRLRDCEEGDWPDDYSNGDHRHAPAAGHPDVPTIDAVHILEDFKHAVGNRAMSSVAINATKYTPLLGQVQLIANHARRLESDIEHPHDLAEEFLDASHEMTAIKLKHAFLKASRKCNKDKAMKGQPAHAVRRQEQIAGKLSTANPEIWLGLLRSHHHGKTSSDDTALFSEEEREDLLRILQETSEEFKDHVKFRLQISEDGSPYPNPHEQMPGDWNWTQLEAWILTK
jgi:hypothetical protein